MSWCFGAARDIGSLALRGVADVGRLGESRRDESTANRRDRLHRVSVDRARGDSGMVADVVWRSGDARDAYEAWFKFCLTPE